MNGTKSTKIAGYPDQMTSREYTAALAMAMLDGTFRENDADTIDYDPQDNSGNDGQHRLAAQMVLAKEV
ncbi:MAG: hypothetical protein JWL89_47 [Candidatus Saccharibacteria bacterium]|nr:hypothetical protein [Candidatus Saccharibacteria bacterium]